MQLSTISSALVGVLFIFQAGIAICQPAEHVNQPIDTLTAIPEDRFKEGAQGFARYLMRNIKYPEAARGKGIVGTSLSSFKITPGGTIAEVAIINSLGGAIDREVTRVLQSTRKLWLPTGNTSSGNEIVMILPIKFSLSSGDFYRDQPNGLSLLDEVVVVGYGATVQIKDDQEYVARSNEFMQGNQYEKALDNLSELIRRNPYNGNLYRVRAKANRALGRTTEACTDLRKIETLVRKTLPDTLLTDCH
jgi:protein TonB